jgi:hypothetical protein
VPEEPGPGLADVIAQQRELPSRLRAVVEAKDAEIAVPRQGLDAERELRRRLELRLAEQERPGHQGKGLQRDPDPGCEEGRRAADAVRQCRR